MIHACQMWGDWSFVPPARREKEKEKAEPPSEALTDVDPILSYRLGRFEGLGLPYPIAFQLAASRTDWHQVARAVTHGITVEQVEAVFL